MLSIIYLAILHIQFPDALSLFAVGEGGGGGGGGGGGWALKD